MSDGTTAISFAYDADGLRTSKTVGNVSFNYTYAGGKLLRETFGNVVLDFFYDANGMPYALKYNGTVYYYITNLQGDVMQLVNSNGSIVASYDYDPYGKVISATGTMAEINPLRYRGYYYDVESGLYYLQSRYYNPEAGRFLNADAFASTGQGLLGINMFAYCLNNPVNHSDPAGKSTIAEGVKNSLWVLPLLDGPIPLGDILSVIALFGVLLYEQSQVEDTIPNISHDTINWESGDKNHILKGTKRKHVDGWKRFGIDPDNNNAWNMVLPILQEVFEKADDVQPTLLPNGSMYIEYIKTYADQGVQVVLKIWVDASGLIQQISDAIPYIID